MMLIKDSGKTVGEGSAITSPAPELHIALFVLYIVSYFAGKLVYLALAQLDAFSTKIFGDAVAGVLSLFRGEKKSYGSSGDDASKDGECDV